MFLITRFVTCCEKVDPMFPFLVMGTILMSFARSALADDVQEIGEIANLLERQQGRCGVDAVYAVCRLRGSNVTYDEVESVTPFSKERGTTVQEFCRSLRSFGIRMVADHTNLDDLNRCSFPLVLLLQDADEVGHYLVVTNITDGIFTVVEARGDKPNEMDLAMIVEQWRGIAIVGTAEWPVFAFWGSMAMAAGVLVSLFCLNAKVRNKDELRCFGIGVGLVTLMGVGVFLLIGMKPFLTSMGQSEQPDRSRATPAYLLESDLPIEFHTFPLFRNGEMDVSRLRSACASVIPYWRYRRFSDLIHALRVFGHDADFSSWEISGSAGEDVELLKGARLFQYVTEPMQYQYDSGSTQPPYCFGFGELAERQGDSPYLPAHRDDILAVFAEMRLPLDTRIVYGSRIHCVRDLLQTSIAKFHPHQELEFTAIAYSMYLPGAGGWCNRFGQEFDFNEIVSGLLRRAEKETACLGTHVPYALACVLQADSQIPVLRPDSRSAARAFLVELSAAIEQNQAISGAFRPAIADWETLKGVEQLHQALLFTGHTLEWMALVEPSLRASESSLRRAWYWGLSAIEAQDPTRFPTGFMYAPNSHLVRALCLLADIEAAIVLGVEGSREN